MRWVETGPMQGFGRMRGGTVGYIARPAETRVPGPAATRRPAAIAAAAAVRHPPGISARHCTRKVSAKDRVEELLVEWAAARLAEDGPLTADGKHLRRACDRNPDAVGQERDEPTQPQLSVAGP